RTVAERIHRYYERDAEVVYPPVDIASFALGGSYREDFYLVVSRLVPYKNVDVAVRAFNELGHALHLRLKVASEGRDRGRLERMASDSVEFLGRQPEAALRELLSLTRGLIFAGEDDFG